MGGYVVNEQWTLRAGEKISVRVDHANFAVRTPPGSTALVYLDQDRPTLMTIPENSNRILTCPPPYPCWASVEAVGGFVIINDPAGTGVPDFSPKWW